MAERMGSVIVRALLSLCDCVSPPMVQDPRPGQNVLEMGFPFGHTKSNGEPVHEFVVGEAVA